MRNKQPNPTKTKIIALGVIALCTVIGKVISDSTDAISERVSQAITLQGSGQVQSPPEPKKQPRRQYTVDLTTDGRLGPRIRADLVAEANQDSRAPYIAYPIAVASFQRVLDVSARLSAWGRSSHQHVPTSPGRVALTGHAPVLERGAAWATEVLERTGNLDNTVWATSALEALAIAELYYKTLAADDLVRSWQFGCLGPESQEVRYVRTRFGLDADAAIVEHIASNSPKSLERLFNAMASLVDAYEARVVEEHQAAGT